jgi:hypothetical protein
MFVRHGSSRQQGQPLYPLVAPVSSPNLDLCVKADFGRFLVDNPSSREQRRVPQQTTTQVAMHPAPVQRAGPSVPASDLGPSPGLRSPENLSAPYPPAPPIRHSSDSLPAGKPVRWVGRETGSASTPRPRATSRRADPAVAPVSASAMPWELRCARKVVAVTPLPLIIPFIHQDCISRTHSGTATAGDCRMHDGPLLK